MLNCALALVEATYKSQNKFLANFIQTNVTVRICNSYIGSYYHNMTHRDGEFGSPFHMFL